MNHLFLLLSNMSQNQIGSFDIIFKYKTIFLYVLRTFVLLKINVIFRLSFHVDAGDDD